MRAIPQYSRRGFIGATAGLVAARLAPAQTPSQDSLPGAAGRLFDPSRAGRPMEPTRPQDNDVTIQGIEKRLKCTCGCNLDIYTCVTTDFTCPDSPGLHREVVALYESGQTAEQIVDAFVGRHGVAILMAPPRRGFNLAAYLVPSVVILAAAAVLVVILRRWTRGATALAAAPSSLDPTASASPPELERLRQELERFPG